MTTRDAEKPGPEKSGRVTDRMGLYVAVVTSLLSALVVVWSTQAQLSDSRDQQQAQFEESQDQALRDLRRPVYTQFAGAANAYYVAHTTRQRECKAGTNLPAVEGKPCTVERLGDLQSVRYDLQIAINEMGAVESDAAEAAVQEVTRTMPPSLTRADFTPAEGPVDRAGFHKAYGAFLDVMRCDTNPTDPCG